MSKWSVILGLMLDTTPNLKSSDNTKTPNWKVVRNIQRIETQMEAVKQMLIQHLYDVTKDGGIVNVNIYLFATKIYYELLRDLKEYRLEETKFMYLLKWFSEEGARQVVVIKKEMTPFNEFSRMKEKLERL